MPRDGSGVYTQPFPNVNEDTTIESAVYNGFVSDVVTDLNAPRPITAGGTGATNTTDAMNAMKGEVARQIVTNYDSHIFISGSFESVGATADPVYPVAGRVFLGVVVVNTAADYIVLEARDLSNGKKYLRTKSSGSWSAWQEQATSILDLDPVYVNVTGDTITGNLDIDGTLNVDGATTLGVVNCAEFTSTPPSLNSMRHASQTYGVFSHFNDVNYYLMCTNVNDRYGNFNSLRPLTMNASTGNISFGHNISVGGTLTAYGAVTIAGMPVHGGIPLIHFSSEGTFTAAADNGKMFCARSGSPVTITINGGVHPEGTVLSFFVNDPSFIAIANTETMMWCSPSGTAIGSRNLARYGVATAVKWLGGNWVISGNGLT